MIDLDDSDGIGRSDPSGFLESVESFADQLRDASRRAEAVDQIPNAGGVSSIAVLGMGGSGISGDASRVALGNDFPIPVHTIRGYQLPGWVDEQTLVFVMSYSGNTEETIATFQQAVRRKARLVIVTTGGELARLGKQDGIPVVEIPAGLQPRAALGYLTIPILVILKKMGLGSKLDAGISESVDLIERRVEEWRQIQPLATNPAKQLAQGLKGKIPIVYGSEGLAEVAAYRWKCQFNECSKVPSWWHSFPELNHNEIVGWHLLKSLTAENLALLVLRPAMEHERISKRIEVTTPMIDSNLSLTEQIRGQGSSALAQFLDLVYFGDFVATYLALASGVDPAPVEVITTLKQQLAK